MLASIEAGRAALAVAPEMAGEDLRRAAHSLARITGVVGGEDGLGEGFDSFCSGK